MKKLNRIVAILMASILMAPSFLSVSMAAAAETAVVVESESQTMGTVSPEIQEESKQPLDEVETPPPVKSIIIGSPSESEMKESENEEPIEESEEKELTDQDLLDLINGNSVSARPMESPLFARAAALQTGSMWALYATDNKLPSLPEINKPTPYKMMFMRVYTNTWHLAYCIEPGIAIDSGDGVGSSTSFASLTAVQKMWLRYAMLLGFNDHGMTDYENLSDKKFSEYVATQAMVWLIVTDYFNTSAGDNIAKKICGAAKDTDHAWNYYKNLRDEMITVSVVPSFSSSVESKAPTVELQWNNSTNKYEASLTDTNGVLSKFDYTIPGVTVTKSGNTLKLSTSTPLSATVAVEGQKKIPIDHGGSLLYWTGTSGPVQSLSTVNWDETNPDPIYSFFKIKSSVRSRVKVAKTDAETGKKLDKAVFELYEYNSSTKKYAKIDTLTKSAEYANTYVSDWLFLSAANEGKYKVIEKTAPSGYIVDTKEYPFVISGSTDGQFITVGNVSNGNFENKPQKGKIKIDKIGDTLTGAKESNDGVTFEYSKSEQAGAEFSIYAAGDIISGDGSTVLYKNGQKVTTLTTGSNGSVTSNELPLGKYKVVEDKAPVNLTRPDDEAKRTQYVTLSYQGQTVNVFTETLQFDNDKPNVAIKAVKKSSNDGSTLEGAVFGLYAGENIQLDGKVIVQKGTLIQKAVSDKDGIAKFSVNNIPINYKYLIKEIQAPEYYIGNSKVEEFTYTYKNDTTYIYEFEAEYQNKEARGNIKLYKVDAESGKAVAQGDGEISNASYGLYAAENIKHPNKKNADLYKKNDLIDIKQTDKDGYIIFSNLYLGKYYLMEESASHGYLLDEELPKQIIDLAYEGQNVEITERVVTSKEKIKKQSFQLIKIGDDGMATEATLLKAGFKIYLISSLAGVKNGEIVPDSTGMYDFKQFRGYDFSKEITALDYSENPAGVPIPELFTDSKTGYLRSPELPYGQYVVVETTVPPDYAPIDPFVVNISDDNREPQVWRVFVDREFTARLKIIKMDAQSQKPVLNPGAAFTIWDVDREKFVVQYTHYPNTVEHSTFATSDEGYLITPEALKPGTYKISEVETPHGYIRGEDVTIVLNSDQAYEIEEGTGAVIIKQEFYNSRQTGTLTLQKTGEKLKSLKNSKGLFRRIGEFIGFIDDEETTFDFEYELAAVEGAEFNLLADEDILSPDHQPDPNNPDQILVLYKKDSVVSVLTTDKEGKAIKESLPLGKYRLEEKTASNGFVLSEESRHFELVYAGDQVDVVFQSVDVINERQKVQLDLIKQEPDGVPIEGVKFGLYVNEDLYNAQGDLVAEKDTLIETTYSDEEGKINFTADLPICSYYLVELETIPGYIANPEPIHFDISYTDQTLPVIIKEAEITNDYTKLLIRKVDEFGNPVIDAELVLTDELGNEVYTWITTEDPLLLERLAPGIYTLTEINAPEGFEIAEPIEITIEESNELIEVEMVDEYIKTGTVSIIKVGDALVGTTQYDTEFGEVSRMEYEKKPLAGVEFTIFDSEDNEIEILVTDAEGLVTSSDLEIGSYYMKETKTPNGLAMNPLIYDFEIETGEDHKVIDLSMDIENNVLDTEINVYKVGEMLNPSTGTLQYGEKALEGIYFGIYVAEEITSYNGDTAVEKDTLIGVIKTNEEGKATLKAALVPGKYYYKELQTLDGFVLDESIHEFSIELENDPVTTFDVNKENPLLNALVKGKLQIIKIDANDEKIKLSGAEFKLYDDTDTCIGVYSTDESGEINIDDLAYGKYYLVESKAPSGYQKLTEKIEFEMTGEDVSITVKNTLIPKLGFDDANTILGIAFIGIAVMIFIAAVVIYRMKILPGKKEGEKLEKKEDGHL